MLFHGVCLCDIGVCDLVSSMLQSGAYEAEFSLWITMLCILVLVRIPAGMEEAIMG